MMYERLADKVSKAICTCLGFAPESDEYQICRYFFHGIFITIIKTAILAALAIPLGIHWYVICFMLTFASLRTFSFGAHVTGSIRCTCAGLIMYLGGGYLSSVIILPHWVQVMIFAGCIVIFYHYAPAGTAARPIFNAERKRLKVLSLIALAVVAASAGAFPMILPEWTGTTMTFAALCQSISLLPVISKASQAKKQKPGKPGESSHNTSASQAIQTKALSAAGSGLPEKPKKPRIKAWQIHVAATVFVAVVVVTPYITNLCFYPLWYGEPYMPECLRKRHEHT